MRRPFLEEVARITGERGAAYGSPAEHWGRTAALWTALLGARLRSPLTADDVARFYIADKMSRDIHTPRRDNLLDIAGYAAGLATVRYPQGDAGGPQGSGSFGAEPTTEGAE